MSETQKRRGKVRIFFSFLDGIAHPETGEKNVTTTMEETNRTKERIAVDRDV